LGWMMAICPYAIWTIDKYSNATNRVTYKPLIIFAAEVCLAVQFVGVSITAFRHSGNTLTVMDVFMMRIILVIGIISSFFAAYALIKYLKFSFKKYYKTGGDENKVNLLLKGADLIKSILKFF